MGEIGRIRPIRPMDGVNAVDWGMGKGYETIVSERTHWIRAQGIFRGGGDFRGTMGKIFRMKG